MPLIFLIFIFVEICSNFLWRETYKTHVVGAQKIFVFLTSVLRLLGMLGLLEEEVERFSAEVIWPAGQGNESRYIFFITTVSAESRYYEG